MTALGRSGIETPSYVFMAVFFAFAILKIIIKTGKERSLEWLSENGREGLKSAFTTMVNEVMLLGFISLILKIAEESIVNICVDKDVYRKHWIPIELVDDCDDCFHNTKRLSEDFYWKQHWEQHCQEHEKGYSPPEHGYKEGRDDDHPYLFRRRLLASSSGPSVCKHGKVQFISARALHDVYTYIFLIGIVHAVVVALMVLIAMFRMRRWMEWTREDDSILLRADEKTWKVVVESRTQREPKSGLSRIPSTIKEDPELLLGVLRYNDQVQGQMPSDTFKARHDKSNFSVVKACLHALNRLRREVPDNHPAILDGDGSEMAKHASRIRLLPLRTQSEEEVPRPQTELPAIREQWTLAFWKQWWRPINKNELRLLRCAFILEHGQGENFEFEKLLLESLNSNVGEIVKIPKVGWLAVIVGYTFWVPMQFSVFPVLVVVVGIEAAVTVACTKLVTIVLILTNDEKIHKLNEKVFWWSKPKLFFPLIRVVLFVNSLLLSSYLFVLWQYGAQSCALVEKIPGAGKNSILRIAGPLAFFFNLFCFFHTSWILLPLYTVNIHTGSTHCGRQLFSHEELTALYRCLKDEEQGALRMELVNRLEDRLKKLKLDVYGPSDSEC